MKKAKKVPVRARKKQKRERIVAPPPRTMTVVDAVSEAWGIIEELGEEMEDWRANMEDKFSTTDKYSRVEEAAQTLQGESEPTEPDSDTVKAITVTIQDPKPRRRSYSRADRLSQATSLLEACEGALDEFASSDDPKTSEDDASEADSYKNDIETLRNNVEGVDFPGMFG